MYLRALRRNRTRTTADKTATPARENELYKTIYIASKWMGRETKGNLHLITISSHASKWIFYIKTLWSIKFKCSLWLCWCNNSPALARILFFVYPVRVLFTLSPAFALNYLPSTVESWSFPSHSFTYYVINSQLQWALALLNWCSRCSGRLQSFGVARFLLFWRRCLFWAARIWPNQIMFQARFDVAKQIED